MWSRVVDGIRFDEPLESEFQVSFGKMGRRSRHEMWLVLLVVMTIGIVFHHALLRLPPEVLPLGRTLLVAVVVPMVLRWLSGDHSPLHSWSSGLYILSVYIDIGCLMAVRIACIRNGYDVVPLAMPVAVLMSLIVVQIRFRLLAPAILAGLAGMLTTELLAFDTTSNRLFDVVASIALVTVALSAAYELERWTRISWLRQRELDELTRTDALTGVPNRRFFEAKLDELVQSAAGGRQLAVLVLDVDEFKAVNDQYGHLAGDECLRRIGAYLNRSLSARDEFCARLGGEEFVAVWCATDPAAIAVRAEELRAGIAGLGLVASPPGGGPLTASAGLVVESMTEPAAITAADLLRRADSALYRAKRSGRDRLAIADGTDVAGARSRRGTPGSRRPSAPKSVDAPATALHPARFTEPSESEFRAVFERQGRGARAAIMIGLDAVCLTILLTQREVLKIPEQADLLGAATLLIGIMPIATLAALVNFVPRLYRWSAALFITAVLVIVSAQMFERVLQLPHGYDVVPYLMPTSVLLSMCVVRIRFGLLLPWTLVGLAWVSAIELWAFPWTSNRLLTVGTTVIMVAVTVRFSYKLERSVRLAWLDERKLDELTRTDPLTGLPNRRSFDDAVDAIPGGTRAAVMILDIDDFKGFNDAHGHPAGDDALRSVGAHLRRATAGQRVVVARIGGEEFAALWPDCGGTVRAEAERLRAGLTAIGPIPGTETSVTASAGFAEAWVSDDAHADQAARDLLTRADHALYEAKRLGRDRLVELTDADPAPPTPPSGLAIRYE